MSFLSEKQIQGLINISKLAGDEVMKIYDNFSADKDVSYKEDNSPLTLADKKSNDIICSFLKKNYPDFSILSEENGNLNLKETEYFWVVDPLDGTKEFIKKNGEFTINIGLCHKQKPVAGFIYAPNFKQLYYAVEGGGAFYSELYPSFNVSQFRQINSSNRVDNLIIAGSRSHASNAEMKLYEDYKHKIAKVRQVGSSLKGCLIAKGEIDLYYRFGLTSKWDTCAMQVICEESGAILRQLDGTDMEYKLNQDSYLNHKGFYIVNNISNLGWV